VQANNFPSRNIEYKIIGATIIIDLKTTNWLPYSRGGRGGRLGARPNTKDDEEEQSRNSLAND
jgi:hypothetical protein